MRMFGSSLADVFSTPAYDCRVAGSDQKPEFAVTRLRSGPRELEKAPVYPAWIEAVLICVSLTPARNRSVESAFADGKNVGVTLAIPFATTFIDLSRRMEMWARGPFDYLHYYLSRELLERIALDNAVSLSFQLPEAFLCRRPGGLANDKKPSSLRQTWRTPRSAGARSGCQRCSVRHILQAHCGTPKFTVPARRGLEPWQKLRTEEMLHAHLEGNVTIKELATACSLSTSHFGRCFRQSFGTSVHQRLIQLRINHARHLLSRTDKTLVEIALLAGFYDQAAFSRTFSRIERMTPSRWRCFKPRRGQDLAPKWGSIFPILMVGNDKAR